MQLLNQPQLLGGTLSSRRCPTPCLGSFGARRSAVVTQAAEYEPYTEAPARPQGGRGRGGGGRYGGGGGRYSGGGGRYGDRQQQDRSYSGSDQTNPAGFRRGPVSYDEDSESGGGGGYRGRGGGRGGRGGQRGGNQQRTARYVSPEMAALNDAITNASSWRELQTVLEQQSRAGMPGLDAFQLVAMLLRLAKLPPPATGDDAADFQQFVASVYGWIMDRLPKFQPRQISGAMLSIGRLNLYNEELVAALVQTSLPQLGNFAAADYARFLDGLERMRVPPGEEWTAEFFRVSADKIVRTAERDELPAIFSLCQRLGLVPPPEWMAATTAAAMDYLAAKGRHIRCEHFRKLLVGLSGLGWRPDPQQLALIVERSFPQLTQGYANVPDLVEIAWSLAQWETPMPAQWAKAFNTAVMRQRRYFRPNTLGSVLYSLAYLRAGPEPSILHSLMDDLAFQYGDATGDDLANIAMALVQFQYVWRNDRLMDDFIITVKAKLPTCSATGLNNLIAALPAMGSGYRLNEVVKEAVSRYDALMAQQQELGGAAAVEAADQQQYEAQQYEAEAEAQPVA